MTGNQKLFRWIASRNLSGRCATPANRLAIRLVGTSVVWLFVLGTVWAALPLELHVAVGGKDTNNGTVTAPLASLAGARSAIREAKRRGAIGAVNVLVHAGVYPVAQPIVFEAQDSGAADAPITYQAAPGERAVFSGGQVITGWKRLDDRLWVTELPEVKAGAWRFRQLYVNGESRPRARSPKQGFFRVANPHPDGNAKAPYNTPAKMFAFAPGDLNPNWTNLEDVEVIVYHFWTDTHVLVESIDTAKSIVTFAYPSRKAFTDDFTPKGARYVVENVFEGLDEPGEWYLNRKTGMLYYRPRPGEDMARVEVIAPRAPAFLQFQAEPQRQTFVEHLIFRRLGFTYTNYDLPAGEVNNAQASACVPAAVTMKGTRHCTFDHCEFKNLGTYAVEIGAGCRETSLVGCDLHHLAAGGIRVNGGNEGVHPSLRTADNVIRDNQVHHYGEVFPSAVGILLMHGEGTTVLHNHIHHGYYTGISIGWVWGYLRSISRDNRIEFNHIHDIGQGLLSDMGGIYTLGVSPGTTIRNNLIHDVDANLYGGWGIYHDEGSTHILVENNVVYNTKFAPFNIHYAKEVTVRNNVFALGRLEQLSRGQVEPHKSVYFEGNIVYWKEGKFLVGNWKDVPYEFHTDPRQVAKTGLPKLTSTFDYDWNLYFNPTLKRDDVRFAGGTWAEWQKRGKDVHSQYADPQFVDPEHGDFRLKPGSPAWGLGFRAIDLATVGPCSPVGP